MSWAAAAPVGRGEAQDAAARELSKGVYHADDPSLVQRVLDKIASWLDRVGGGLDPRTASGLAALILLLAVVGGVLALIAWRTGALRRAATRDDRGLGTSDRLGPDEHRRLADQYAAQRRYADAVRERMRAIVRELEARGVLDPRPGRTAAEAAADAGRLVPAVAGDLRSAARLFEEVWFGGRAATAGTDAALREVDQRVRSARLAVTGAPR